MKAFVLIAAGLSIFLSSYAQDGKQAPKLPLTPKVPVEDVYFGKKITDNYRWLEDMDSPQTKDWFKSQGQYTASVMDQLPGRDSLINAFVKLDAMQSARYGNVVSRLNEEGQRIYFYRKTLANENVSKIYYRIGKTGKEMLLFDPLAYSKTKKYAVSGFDPSENGQYVSLGVAEGGLEISTVKILNISTKTFLPDSLPNVFSGRVVWTPDSKGIIYTPIKSADPSDKNGFLNTISKYHALNTSSEKDIQLMSAAKNPELNILPSERPDLYFTEDYKHIIASISTVDRRMNAWIAPAADFLKPDLKWNQLLAKEDSVYQFVLVRDKMFFFSVKSAPSGRVLVTSANNPDLKTAQVAIPESKETIYAIDASKDFLLLTKDEVVRSHFQQYDVAAGKLQDVTQPYPGIGFIISSDPHANDIYFALTSWTRPFTFYDYDPLKNQAAVSAFQVVAKYPGIEDLVVEEIEIPSHDGVMVPISIIYRKGMKKDGSNSCFMTGYGAYGASSYPHFDIMNLAMLNKGVIIAQAHVRGGAEKGMNWYKAGFKTTKPNTWKDFIACGEWLVKNGYTSSSHLIGSGTSAGGILIGRAITERPELFAAAINNVGATNILRMENTMNGPNNVPEFGTVKDSVECMALIEMDAVQHVKDGVAYPAVLSVGGMNDPRVIVWQPGKFAAAMQNASSSGKPVFMQVNDDNGHFTEDKKVTFRNFANMFAFGLWQAGHPDFRP